MASCANRTCGEPDHDKHHSVAEVKNLLRLHRILLVSPEPVFIAATDRRHALEAGTEARRLPDRIGSVEALCRVKVTAVRSLKETARKLRQIGSRGLPRHVPLSIPQTISRWNASLPVGRCCALASRARRLPTYGAAQGVSARKWLGSTAGMRRQVVQKGTLVYGPALA